MLRMSLVILGLVLAWLAQPAHAQTGDAPADEPVEEIVVTGSRLPRRDFTAVSPIATIESEALTYAGQATLEETLNKLPQVTPDFGRASNGVGNGKSQINLRGLGAGRTLVMLNGRRLAPSGIGTAVDVNNLPQALMDRVEVITGGASTVYGSDAVAGVVNFITRDDFVGFAVDASAYVTEEGDSEIYDINVTWGHEFDRGNIALYGGFYDRSETFQVERAFSAVALNDTWQGEVRPGGSPIIPAGIIFQPQIDLGTGATPTTFDGNGVPIPYDPVTGAYNYAPVNYLQTPLTRRSAGAFATYELGADLELYAEVSYANNQAAKTLAPVPAQGFFEINPDNPLLSPEAQQLFADQLFPVSATTVGMVFGRRLSELGARIIETDNDYTRVAAGLRGPINATWDFDAWVTYTRGDEDEGFLNDASYSRMQQGLLVDPGTGECFDPTDGCVPLNVFGEGNLSQAGLDFIRYEPFLNKTSRTQKLASAFVRGAPFDAWAGPINMAFGVEWRDDDGTFRADTALFTDDTLGYRASASVNGSESVWEIYTEATIPLAEGAPWAEYLGLEVGGRYSEYENAGSVDSFKFGGEWQLPIPVRFRAMFQRSVRAPNLEEAFTEQGIERGSYTSGAGFDPCSASRDPVGAGLREACIATGLPADQVGVFEATEGFPTDFVFGGNPLLEPEKAETLTLGVVLELDWLQGVQVSIDYFDLEVSDTIGEIDATIACFDEANAANLFCGNIERDATTYNVNRVYEPFVNRGELRTEGIDTMVSVDAELPAGLALFDGQADLAFGLAWTHVLKNSEQETSFGTEFDCAGLFGYPCIYALSRFIDAYPEDRVLANLRYYSGDFMASLSWRWISGTDNGVLTYGDVLGAGWADPGVPSIGSVSYSDLGMAYSFNENVEARLTIANLANQGPPLLANNSFGPNTDSTLYDVFGRSYTLMVALRF